MKKYILHSATDSADLRLEVFNTFKEARAAMKLEISGVRSEYGRHARARANESCYCLLEICGGEEFVVWEIKEVEF